MTDWRDTAACAGVPLEVFFPNFGPGQNSHNSGPVWDEALRLCGTCPHTGIYGPCVREGFAIGDDHGMRGGMRPDELRRLYRLRRRGAA